MLLYVFRYNVEVLSVGENMESGLECCSGCKR